MILEKVQFETNSARILPQSNEILDAVAATLKGHDEFLVVEVAGHADERAGDDHNLRLTKARAASVVEALRSRGISTNRLVSQGYGEYCPLDAESNPRSLGEEPPRRVQDRQDRSRRSHGREARLRRGTRQGRESSAGAVDQRVSGSVRQR